MTAPLYPLRFVPTFRRYIWGGRRLGDVLGKPIGEGDDYAESWEVVDHGEDQSVVAYGALLGKTLNELVTGRCDELMGGTRVFDRFPLLFKLLDCNRNLSVQVHPNDEQGRLLDPPDLGKTEAWVILDAAPRSQLFAGLKSGVDRETLTRAVEQGSTEACLHAIEPKAGDCVFIPAGTVHALGEGMLVAEIQQSSDTTFRLFDWNRVGADGTPRPLHIQESLETIDYQRGPVTPQTPQPMDVRGLERLVACDKFELDRWQLESPATLELKGQFKILAVVQGEVEVEGDPSELPLTRGQTCLIPAACESVGLKLDAPATVLVMGLPRP